MEKRITTHPGIVFRWDVLDAQGVDENAFLDDFNLGTRFIEFLEGKVAITKVYAAILAAYTGTTMESWLEMQSLYDASVVEIIKDARDRLNRRERISFSDLFHGLTDGRYIGNQKQIDFLCQESGLSEVYVMEILNGDTQPCHTFLQTVTKLVGLPHLDWFALINTKDIHYSKRLSKHPECTRYVGEYYAEYKEKALPEVPSDPKGTYYSVVGRGQLGELILEHNDFLLSDGERWLVIK